MLKKEARKITGGLSKPSKMPGPAHNLPAWRCITGVKLQAVPGAVCAGCYAMNGRYRFKNVKEQSVGDENGKGLLDSLFELLEEHKTNLFICFAGSFFISFAIGNYISNY